VRASAAGVPSRTGRAAVFLDRDGVLNRSAVRDGKPRAPRTLAEFRMLPGVRRAVERLRRRNLLIVVVTNQPDIGHGLIDPAQVEAMHERLASRIPIDAIEICPHRQDAGCDCRKPRIGMLKAAARRLKIDFSRSFMVGDRASDVLAGHDAGCYTIFVNRGYDTHMSVRPNGIARSLSGAVDIIVRVVEQHNLEKVHR